MNIPISSEKRCENCRYFSQHYARQNTKFRPVGCGHCLHPNVKAFKKQTYKVCEHWEDAGDRNEELKKSVKQTLESMSEKLNQIALIFEDD